MLADILGLELTTVETVLGLAGGLIAMGSVVWGAIKAARGRIGRRQRRYAAIKRLSAGILLSGFRNALGMEPALANDRRAEVQAYDDQGRPYPVEKTFRQHFFVAPEFYVQAVCDETETVLAYSVTTRSKRFRPTFEFPPKPSWRGRRKYKREAGKDFEFFHEATLGQTKFASLGSSWTPQIKASCGARSYSYTEAFYYGNPGYYQHYAFTASSAVRGDVGSIADLSQALGRQWVGGFDGHEGDRLAASDLVARFRSETTITTFTVIGVGLNPTDFPTTFGPHGDEVRVVPT